MDEDHVPTLSEEEERAKEERIKKLTPLARDVVMVLVKTIKATGMYMPNNPIYQKFREELKEKFESYFEYEDMLSFMVKRFELTFLDQEVYHNPDKEDNVALMFFKDGIREFCFHKGITQEDIDGFIDILKVDTKERELDDDLVTLMWEKDFQNISYTVTDEATDEEAAEEHTLLTFEEEPEALKQLDELRARATAEAAQEPAGGGTAGPSSGSTVSAGEAALAALLTTDAEDLEAVRGSYKPPDDLGLLTELTDIFYEILITEKDPERFDMVAGSMSKALDIFVGRGDLALATVLVMKVQELANAPELAKASAARLDDIIAKACSEALVKKVGEFINQGGQDALESAGSYLRQLDQRALGPMVGLLETLDGRKSRRAVCDMMAEMCGGKGKALLGFLSHRYWYVTRNVAMVLGKVADPETVAPLGGLLKHGDGRVRKEALNALAAMKVDKAAGHIATGMDDADRQIRILSARLLAETAPEKAYDLLTVRVKEKSFDGREFDEKKDFFELLGRTGGARAMPFLVELFKKTGLFKSASRDRLRACAAYGLAAAGGDEAYGLLRSEIDSKSKVVRAACLDGLRRMGR